MRNDCEASKTTAAIEHIEGNQGIRCTNTFSAGFSSAHRSTVMLMLLSRSDEYRFEKVLGGMASDTVENTSRKRQAKFSVKVRPRSDCDTALTARCVT